MTPTSPVMKIVIFKLNFYYCRVNVTFIDRDGDRHDIQGKVGDNVLYLAHRHGIEMEGNSTKSSIPLYIAHLYLNNS